MASSTGVQDRMDCTKDTCRVEDSVYGYYPSAPASAIFIALFVVSAVIHVFQGARTKSWSFLAVLAIGTILEAIGYVGRILLRNDPFSDTFIAIQLICITVAPAFIAAGIYLTLKHIIIVHGSQFSRLTPQWYTRIFITCDITSIVIQTIGAILAAGGSSTTAGNNVIMVGLASQVFTLLVFGIMALDVWSRIAKHQGEFNSSAKGMRGSRKFKGLIGAIIVSYGTILIRCIYRIAEMAGGWRNPIMQDQASFIVLESTMCAISVLALNVFHPGFMFQQSQKTSKVEIEGSDLQGV